MDTGIESETKEKCFDALIDEWLEISNPTAQFVDEKKDVISLKYMSDINMDRENDTPFIAHDPWLESRHLIENGCALLIADYMESIVEGFYFQRPIAMFMQLAPQTDYC